MARTSDSTDGPPLGGWLPPTQFNDLEVRILDAIADELIPGGEGFPLPSEANVVGFIARYVAPRGKPAKWFPFFGEDDFKTRLAGFGPSFADASSSERVEALKIVERDEAGYFARLRDLIYFAYYSRPEVIRAINLNLEAGRDYRYTPQPFGYSDNMKEWDKEMLGRVKGTYKRTEDVIRLDLAGLSR